MTKQKNVILHELFSLFIKGKFKQKFIFAKFVNEGFLKFICQINYIEVGGKYTLNTFH